MPSWTYPPAPRPPHTRSVLSRRDAGLKTGLLSGEETAPEEASGAWRMERVLLRSPETDASPEVGCNGPETQGCHNHPPVACDAMGRPSPACPGLGGLGKRW